VLVLVFNWGDTDARNQFIQGYIDEHFEERIRGAFES
jgi:hypothetical protein